MIKPFGDNILVKPVEKKSILMSDMNSLCEYGEVIAIGDEVKHIKVGDMIGYTIWGVNKLQIDEQTHYFIPEDSRFILGTIGVSGELASQIQDPSKLGNRSTGSL
jgi:co-chaperonin GroES (HSP10)